MLLFRGASASEHQSQLIAVEECLLKREGRRTNQGRGTADQSGVWDGGPIRGVGRRTNQGRGTADQAGARDHNPAEQTATLVAASSPPFIVTYHHSTRLGRDIFEQEYF